MVSLVSCTIILSGGMFLHLQPSLHHQPRSPVANDTLRYDRVQYGCGETERTDAAQSETSRTSDTRQRGGDNSVAQCQPLHHPPTIPPKLANPSSPQKSVNNMSAITVKITPPQVTLHSLRLCNTSKVHIPTLGMDTHHPYFRVGLRHARPFNQRRNDDATPRATRTSGIVGHFTVKHWVESHVSTKCVHEQHGRILQSTLWTGRTWRYELVALCGDAQF